MNLSTAIDQYVARKRAVGYAFANEEYRLTRFLRIIGDSELNELTSDHVLRYLDDGGNLTVTWRNKYFLLFRFFEFWFNRQLMTRLVMPPLRPRVPQTFVPYVYTKTELRSLIRAVPQCQETANCRIRASTLRAVLMALYGTGARLGEILALKVADLDMRKGMLRIKGTGLRHERIIPLNGDLLKEISHDRNLGQLPPAENGIFFQQMTERQFHRGHLGIPSGDCVEYRVWHKVPAPAGSRVSKTYDRHLLSTGSLPGYGATRT